jgi:TetR/AcrR family fatty acid metabolism transcriptional regulator
VARQSKKQQIMLAAEKLFTSRRFHEIKLDDIAREAKVGKGTIYLYFANKDDLFSQTATSGFEELCQLLAQSVSPKAPFIEELLTACRQISRFFEKRHQLFRMMNEEEVRLCFSKGNIRDKWLNKRRLLVAAVAAIMRKGINEDRVRGGILPEVLADFLLGMLRTRARDLVDAPKAMRQHTVVVDLFCNGALSRRKKTPVKVRHRHTLDRTEAGMPG